MSGCCCSGDPSYSYPESYVSSPVKAWPPNPVKVFKGDVDRLYSTRSVWKCGAWYWSWPPYGAGPQTYNVSPLPNHTRKSFEDKFLFGQLGGTLPYEEPTKLNTGR
jgi:hypothetical protein